MKLSVTSERKPRDRGGQYSSNTIHRQQPDRQGIEDEARKSADLIDFAVLRVQHQLQARSWAVIWAKIAGNFVISVIENYRKQMRRVLKNSRRFSQITSPESQSRFRVFIHRQPDGRRLVLNRKMAEPSPRHGRHRMRAAVRVPAYISWAGRDSADTRKIRRQHRRHRLTGASESTGNRIKLMLSLA